MNEIKGYRLYVNLSASQTRRRLKGFGHGVRKVESAGRNQALIIHAATGEHLRELEAVFADVAPATTRSALGTPVDNLRNLYVMRDMYLHLPAVEPEYAHYSSYAIGICDLL